MGLLSLLDKLMDTLAKENEFEVVVGKQKC